MKSAFPVLLLHKSCLCLTDRSSTVEVTHLPLYCLNKESHQLKCLELTSALCALEALLIRREGTGLPALLSSTTILSTTSYSPGFCQKIYQITDISCRAETQEIVNLSFHSRGSREFFYSVWLIKPFCKSHYTFLSYLVPNSPDI